MKPLFLIGVAACLFASGCDSKKPLSDPQTSKADERLAGVWRDRSDGEIEYFHVGHAGEKFPSSMMRVGCNLYAALGQAASRIAISGNGA